MTTISAERSLDEADNVKEKPLSTVMNRIFKSDVSEIEEEIATQTQSLKEFVDKQSLNAENRVNEILFDIVSNTAPFGYSQNLGKYLKVFLNDGEIPIDNSTIY